jgi:hypothetical protein
MREASATGGAGVSIGEHFEVGGSGQATFKDGQATVGVSGDVAAIIGLNVDASVTIDTHQIQKDSKVVARETTKAVDTVVHETKPVVHETAKVTNTVVNETKKTTKSMGDHIKKIFKW